MSDELRPSRRRHERPRLSLIGVLGELLVTAGVLVLLFLGWQLWLNDVIVGGQQNASAAELAHSWVADLPAAPTPPDAPPTQPVSYGEPVVATEPTEATKFAIMYIPRFGPDYARSIAEGVGTVKVLNKNGIGHYPGTQMPGQIGNFAVAAHRTTHGAPFNSIATLRVGDRIYVQTEQGYYTYVYRNTEYVYPNGVGVKNPVPQSKTAATTGRLLTMTSCNPKLSAAERIVAYSVFDSWQPLSAGPPAEIAALVLKGS
ncbi:class E sortase [Parafrigoribacterium mesophilum]|uniref:class E sortase n=1 Tax=Parafrigoribacterium mesophilum TaxID=433646 RepID=UPI0031FD53B6